MIKIAVCVVNTHTGITQSGVICEPVQPGFEIQNALAHFGVMDYSIESSVDATNNIKMITGKVPDTDNYFTLIKFNHEV